MPDTELSPNISQAEFIIIHAGIDRLLGLSLDGRIRITLSEIRKLKDLRRKPTYLTQAQKSLAYGILNAVIIRHRNLYKILTPDSKTKQVQPTMQDLKRQLLLVYSELLDNLKQPAVS